MRLVKTDKEKRILHLSRRELVIMLELLKSYPVLSTGFQPLVKPGQGNEVSQDDQELLEQSLAEQKKLHKQFINGFFQENAPLKKTKDGWHLSLKVEEIDTLLQVFNDIRVGHWYLAGCPDENEGEPVDVNENNLQHFWTMELCAGFQSHLLQAISGGDLL